MKDSFEHHVELFLNEPAATQLGHPNIMVLMEGGTARSAKLNGWGLWGQWGKWGKWGKWSMGAQQVKVVQAGQVGQAHHEIQCSLEPYTLNFQL